MEGRELLLTQWSTAHELKLKLWKYVLNGRRLIIPAISANASYPNLLNNLLYDSSPICHTLDNVDEAEVYIPRTLGIAELKRFHVELWVA